MGIRHQREFGASGDNCEHEARLDTECLDTFVSKACREIKGAAGHARRGQGGVSLPTSRVWPHRPCRHSFGPVRRRRRPRRIALFALGHCRLLEIGDSLGDDLEYGLRHELQYTPGLKLIQRNKSSTGLSAAWYYNWPAHLKSFLHDYHPDLVVVMFGANDEQALAVNGVSQPFGSTEMAKRVHLARASNRSDDHQGRRLRLLGRSPDCRAQELQPRDFGH